MNRNHLEQPRKGCEDMWNAFMVKNAEFTLGTDMPLCGSKHPGVIPKELISYEEAKQIYRKRIKSDSSFFVDAFVHFYIDDQKFDGKRSSIWLFPYKAWKVLKHFAGVITPDFSTNQDFPDPIKRNNTYRMRAFGVWLEHLGIPVINNVRWGTSETWCYCFDGIPINSIVAVGTVGSGLHKLENRPVFYEGIYKIVDILNPHTIIVYGSANYACFDLLREKGINIIVFPSNTSLAFKGRH